MFAYSFDDQLYVGRYPTREAALIAAGTVLGDRQRVYTGQVQIPLPDQGPLTDAVEPIVGSLVNRESFMTPLRILIADYIKAKMPVERRFIFDVEEACTG